MKKGFFRNAAILTAGNLSSRVITVALMPVITRVFSPEVFGSFAVCLSFSSIFIAISCFRYHVGIIIAETEEDSAAMVILSLLVNLAVSLVLGLVLWVFKDEILTSLGVSEYGYMAPYIAVIVFLGGTIEILYNWFLRQKSFGWLAISRMAEAGGNRASTIAFGLLGMATPLGLILGKIVGEVGGILTMFSGQMRKHLALMRKGADPARIARLAKEHSYLPKYSLSALLQRGNAQLPILLLGFYFSPAVVGLYALGKRTVTEPLQVLGEALASSFLQKNAEDMRKGRDIGEFSFIVFKYLLALTMPPLLVFVLIAPELIAIFFGARWEQAGYYLQALYPMLISVFLMRPMNNIFDLKRKQRERLLLTGLNTIFIALSFIVGGMAGNAMLSVVLFSTTGFITIFFRIFWLLGIVGVNRWRVARALLTILGFSVLAGAPVIFVKEVLQAGIVVNALVALLMIGLYLGGLFYFDKGLREKIKPSKTGNAA